MSKDLCIELINRFLDKMSEEQANRVFALVNGMYVRRSADGLQTENNRNA